MITVFEAEKIIADALSLFPMVETPLEEAEGKVLREDILADRGNPPFDRVVMDGIALSFSEYQRGVRTFKIEGIAPAGAPQTALQNPRSCIEVMTGAVLPEGTDCVLRIEDLDIKNGSATLKEGCNPEKKQNVHKKESDYKAGDILVRKGQRLLGPEMAVAASVGKTTLLTPTSPAIAIVATGNELVAVGELPLEHQIRCSNISGISASLKLHGYRNLSTCLLQDDKEVLEKSLHELLEKNDLLIVSGGVSKGKFDFIPEIMEGLGVVKLFHRIRQKPGKPMWFGHKGKKLVFGLPGNPVSTTVCLHRYVLPALRKASGETERSMFVRLAEEFRFKENLTCFLPVKVNITKEALLEAFPVKTNGSGDFASLVGCDGFVELDASREVFEVGSNLPFYSWSPYYS